MTANKTLTLLLEAIESAFSAKIVVRSLTICGFLASIMVMVVQVLSTTDRIDMMVYRAGAQAYVDGGSLYGEPFEVFGLKLPFIYPPFAALLLAPFTLLTDVGAGYAMVVISALFLLVCIWFLAQNLLRDTGLALLLTSWAWGLILLSEPVRANASFGQINMWLLVLVFLDLVPRRRRIPQGWLIGVAAAIKLTPVVMLFVFLIKRDWRAIASAIVGFLGATGVAALYNTRETVDFYTRAIFIMNDNSKIGVNIAYISNQSIKGVITRLWPSNDAANAASSLINIIWLVLVAVTIAAFFFIIKALLNRDLFLLAAFANSALMLLISPISWNHHWVWLPLWLIVLWHYSWRLRSRDGLVTAAILSFFTLTVPPQWWLGDPTGDQDFQQHLFMKIFMDDYFFWCLMLTVMLCVAMPRIMDLTRPDQVSPAR